MSTTDFCVEAILQKSGSSSSLNSSSSSDSRKPDTPVQKQAQKRKREEEEESEQPTKRGRTCYNKKQLSYLEAYYSHNSYPDKLQKEEIATKLSLPQRKIHVSATVDH